MADFENDNGRYAGKYLHLGETPAPSNQSIFFLPRRAPVRPRP